jgi:hypothetical protein
MHLKIQVGENPIKDFKHLRQHEFVIPKYQCTNKKIENIFESRHVGRGTCCQLENWPLQKGFLSLNADHTQDMLQRKAHLLDILGASSDAANLPSFEAIAFASISIYFLLLGNLCSVLPVVSIM